jgi:hypothetical protein
MTMLLEFSVVRIFDASERSVVSVSFLTDEGMILTCAHVVVDTSDISENSPTLPETSISLDFPLVALKHRLTARVIHWIEVKTGGSGDIAVLRHEKGSTPFCQDSPVEQLSTRVEHLKQNAYTD